MPTQVQFRRGSTTQHGSFTGANGEITIDVNKKTVVVHDGSTAGGFPLAPNTVFDVANAAFTSANNVAPQVAPSFNTANAAFDKANSANVLAYNTGIGANGYTDSATISANNYAGVMANAANAYATSLTPDLSPAFNKANDAYTQANAANVLAYNTGIGANAYSVSVGAAGNAYVNVSTGAANAYSIIVGAASNDYTNTVGTSANNYAGAMANSSNGYTVTVGASANNYAGAMANSGNSWTQTIVDANLVTASAYTNTSTTAANNYAGAILSPAYNTANASFDKANTALQNTSGAVFTGNFFVANSVGVGRATTGYALDVVGTVNASALLINGAALSGGASIGDQTTSASTFYPVFTSTTSGTMSVANVATTKLYFVPTSGTLSATVFNSLSDITYKTDIEELNGIELLNKVNPISFKWKDTGVRSYGVIAQELEQTLPELVETNDQGIKSVSYMPMIAMLIDVVKKQQKEIDKLKTLLNNQKVTE